MKNVTLLCMPLQPTWLLGASLLACLGGCQLAPRDKASWAWQKNTAKVVPDRILPVWTDSVLHQPGQPGVRGFGGRVYFYGKENTDPIEVDGSFAVYVFDAEIDAPTDQKPLRKFVFTADQFQTHMSKTSMGPSYSVWIPWGEVGGAPRKLSLIARFEGREGGTTISDPTIKMLPGIPANKESHPTDKGSEAGTASPISLAAHSESAHSEAAQKKGSDETKSKDSNVGSIDLPPAFQRHLRWPATNSESIQAAESIRALSQPAGDPSASVKPPDDAEKKGESRASAEPLTGPVTTRVFDYRSRGSQKFSEASRARQTRNDIHSGRWIESVSRVGK